MLECLDDWMIEWLPLAILEANTIISFRFVSCLLEMTKIFLDDHFLLDDISKQDYDSNGTICLNISQEL
jgi:hypothetical protein